MADHCASSAGKTELPVDKYHIPLIIFSPGGQLPIGHITTLASQIDYAPTLLGLLNWSYPSRFFGHDVRSIDPVEGHALIGNYQKLGHLEEGSFTVLKPVREMAEYRYDFTSHSMTHIPPDRVREEETISYYEVASYLYQHRQYKALTDGEFSSFMQKHATLATEPNSKHCKTDSGCRIDPWTF